MRTLVIIALASLATSAGAQPAPVGRLPPVKRPNNVVFPGRIHVQIDASSILPKHWDFEDGTLQGFVPEDIPPFASGAFANQPTLGDNISAARALDVTAARIPADPCAGLVLDARLVCEQGPGAVPEYLQQLRTDLANLRANLDTLGGTYWNTPFPIGKQGNFWIGSAEDHSTRSGGPVPWGRQSGDRVAGRLVSPEVKLVHRYFHFLVGGGCSPDVGVYLQVQQQIVHVTPSQGPPGPHPIHPPSGPNVISDGPRWVTAHDATGALVEARGACMENMVRVVFDVGNLKGSNARIVIEDRATGAWGHINVDDIWLTDAMPPASERASDPVWAVADLHAHLMNEKGYIAYDSAGANPEARVLWGSALGPIENLRPCNDTHTTSGWNYSSVQDELGGSTYTLCRDLCLNMIEGAGLKDYPGDQIDQSPGLGGYHLTWGGYPDFMGWPMWWSATHQQMHNTWVRRAFNGGVRLMIAAVGNSEIMAFSMSKEKTRPFTSDQDALALEIPAIKQFAAENHDWAEVAFTPRDARRIINSNKLAIVIGVELDHVFDSCDADVTTVRHHTATEDAEPNAWLAANHLDVDLASVIAAAAEMILTGKARVMHGSTHPAHCTDAQVEARLDALYHQGVRQLLPMHFSDNLLGGYAITDSLFTASAIFGNAGGHPPELLQDLVGSFGASAAPFTPVAREAYAGENADRRKAWQKALPIQNRLDGVSLPIWFTAGAGAVLDGTLLPPGIGRSIMQALTGQCISDDGLRWALGVLSGGMSEMSCAATTLTDAAVDAARSTMPYEGALDSAAMVPVSAPGRWSQLAFHVNARGLQHEGQVLIGQMMRRGMLIDLQHSSELTKRGILALTRAYPVMASHGGVQNGVGRATENVLSIDHLRTVYAPTNGMTSGIVGIGTQSSKGFIGQLRMVLNDNAATPTALAIQREHRSIALGTDLNGMDWHAPPRFGQFAYYAPVALDPPDPTRERAMRQSTNFDGGIGPMVPYDRIANGSDLWSHTLPTCNGVPCTGWSSPAAAVAPLHPLQIRSGGQITRTFDINYDGLAHYGMLPDWLQELSVLGASPEELGAVFRSGEGMIEMWEEGCYQAYDAPAAGRPRRLSEGCGPESLYR